MIPNGETIPSQGLYIKISWVAGIIDGEGSISLYPDKRKAGRKVYGITIVNSDMKIIDRSIHVFTLLGLFYSLSEKTATKKHYEGSHRYTKPCYALNIRRRDDVEKLLTIITPYLVGDKQGKAHQVLEYLRDNPRRTKILKLCENCKQTISSRQPRFCSLKCWHEYAVGISNPNWRHGMYESGVETER